MTSAFLRIGALPFNLERCLVKDYSYLRVTNVSGVVESLASLEPMDKLAGI
jgi:hypothetical protein